MLNRLKTVKKGQEELKQDTAVLKIQMQVARADILNVRESQADLRDRLIEHSEDLKAIKGKQDAHTEVLGQIVNLSEDHTKRFDRVDTSIAELRATQTEQSKRMDTMNNKLDLILTLLQPKG